MVRALPDETDTLFSFDVRALRASPVISRLSTTVNAIPSLSELISLQTCTASFFGLTLGADRVILGGETPVINRTGILAWIVGVQRTEYERCRDRPENKRLLATAQLSEYVEGDMVTQRGPNYLNQILWVAPDQAVAVSHPEREPVDVLTLRRIAERARVTVGQGMLQRSMIRDLFEHVDRNAAAWAISDSRDLLQYPLEGAAVALHVTNRIDVEIRLIASSAIEAEEVRTQIERYARLAQNAGFLENFTATVRDSEILVSFGAGPTQIDAAISAARGLVDDLVDDLVKRELSEQQPESF